MSVDIIIGIVCAVVGALIAYATFMHNEKKENRADGQEVGTMLTEIGYIKGGIDDIKTEQREQRKTNIDFIARLTAVESSATSAHKRIDLIEGREPRD